jgi:hypothetical protein
MEEVKKLTSDTVNSSLMISLAPNSNTGDWSEIGLYNVEISASLKEYPEIEFV